MNAQGVDGSKGLAEVGLKTSVEAVDEFGSVLCGAGLQDSVDEVDASQVLMDGVQKQGIQRLPEQCGGRWKLLDGLRGWLLGVSRSHDEDVVCPQSEGGGDRRILPQRAIDHRLTFNLDGWKQEWNRARGQDVICTNPGVLATNTRVALHRICSDVSVDELNAETGRDLGGRHDERGQAASIDGLVELRPWVGLPHQGMEWASIDPGHLIIGRPPQYPHGRTQQVQGHKAVHIGT